MSDDDDFHERAIEVLLQHEAEELCSLISEIKQPVGFAELQKKLQMPYQDLLEHLVAADASQLATVNDGWQVSVTALGRAAVADQKKRLAAQGGVEAKMLRIGVASIYAGILGGLASIVGTLGSPVTGAHLVGLDLSTLVMVAGAALYTIPALRTAPNQAQLSKEGQAALSAVAHAFVGARKEDEDKSMAVEEAKAVGLAVAIEHLGSPALITQLKPANQVLFMAALASHRGYLAIGEGGALSITDLGREKFGGLEGKLTFRKLDDGSSELED